MKTPQSNQFVFTKKTALMQRIADFVRTGHRWWVAGQIHAEKALRFSEKMGALYQVNLSHMQASRRRKSGRASFRLFMYHGGGETLHWWMLRTDGEIPPEAQREKWRDALTDRVFMPKGYELVRLTRPGSDAPAWTWRYSAFYYKWLRESIIKVIRTRRDDILRRLVHEEVARTPGFAGARAQVRQIYRLIKGEWRRTRGSDPAPDLPARIGYVQRLKDVGMPLDKLLKKIERGG